MKKFLYMLIILSVTTSILAERPLFIFNHVYNKTHKEIIFKTHDKELFRIQPNASQKINQVIPEKLFIGYVHEASPKLVMVCDKLHILGGARCSLSTDVDGKSNYTEIISEDKYPASRVLGKAGIIVDIVIQGNNLEQSEIEFATALVKK